MDIDLCDVLFLDTTIHPIQQAYNKPQQLTSRINLAEITRDISLDPPQEVFIVEENSPNKTHTPQVIPPTIRGKINRFYVYRSIVNLSFQTFYFNRNRIKKKKTRKYYVTIIIIRFYSTFS